jgi:hypothetical protein
MTDFMDRHFKYLTQGKKEYTEAEVRMIIDGAIQEGMKREHAMWVLAKVGEEIEIETEEDIVVVKKDELEYCPHGRYINYSCKDCDAEEHADRMHSYGE